MKPIFGSIIQSLLSEWSQNDRWIKCNALICLYYIYYNPIRPYCQEKHDGNLRFFIIFPNMKKSSAIYGCFLSSCSVICQYIFLQFYRIRRVGQRFHNIFRITDIGNADTPVFPNTADIVGICFGNRRKPCKVRSVKVHPDHQVFRCCQRTDLTKCRIAKIDMTRSQPFPQWVLPRAASARAPKSEVFHSRFPLVP